MRGNLAIRFGVAFWLVGVLGSGLSAMQEPDPYPEPNPAEVGAWGPPINLWAMHPTTSSCPPGASPPQPCNEIAHEILIPAGPKAGWVLYWRADFGLPQDTYLWNPRTNQVFVFPVVDPGPPARNGNLFCSGHAFLPDGRLVVAGGLDLPNQNQGSQDTWIFDPFVLTGSPPAGNPWSYLGPMVWPRYYPTLVRLPNGDIGAFGGERCTSCTCVQPVGNQCFNDDFEILPWNNGALGSWALALDQVSGALLDLPGSDQFALYPHVKLFSGPHQAPGSMPDTADLGVVLHNDASVGPPPSFDPTHKGWLLSRTDIGDGVAIPWTTGSQMGQNFTRLDGNSIRDPSNLDLFYTIGGRDGFLTGLPGGANGRSEVFYREFRFTAPLDQWAQLPSSLVTGRVYCDTVGLPDASVVVFHGTVLDYKQTGASPISPAIPASHPERYVFGSAQPWKELAPEAHLRGYHGGALLLDTGEVASMGSQFDAPPPATPVTGFQFQSDAQIFSPPNQFQGPKPRLASPMPPISYGTPFPITVTLPANDSIGSVVLTAPGSNTHGIDFEQRFVSLTIQSFSPPTPLGGGWVSVTYTVLGPPQDAGTSPPESHVAPPGYYMLWVVTTPTVIAAQGIPSKAAFVQVQ